MNGFNRHHCDPPLRFLNVLRGELGRPVLQAYYLELFCFAFEKAGLRSLGTIVRV